VPRSQPKYLALYDLLVQRIRSGEWEPGCQLPSEPQLAEEYGMAYMTVRQSIHALVNEGLLYRVHGRGTFVATHAQDVRPSLGMLLLPNWYSVDPFYFPPLVTGFVERANELGFNVHLAERSKPLVELLKLKELRVPAVAAVIHDKSDLLDAEALLNQGVLVVAINRYGGSRRIPAVCPDNRGGAYQATLKVIELGHRHIIHLAGPKWNYDAIERRKGVELAYRASGLPKDGLKIMEVGFAEEQGLVAAKRILAMLKPPTAVMSCNDPVAMALVRGLKRGGLRVPEDISVCGFGDMRLSDLFDPALTTVRLPTDELGRRSAEALVALYRGVRHEPVNLPCPLVWRETVAVPRH